MQWKYYIDENINSLLKLINILADGTFCSELYLINKLNLSSYMINNYIKIISYWGVELYIFPGKGYRLNTPLQLLDQQIIQPKLKFGRIMVLPVINSTNQYLTERINYLISGDTCIAEYQIQGRGRQGKSWISTFGNNIYLSTYWFFKQKKTVNGLSLMVAIIIAEILKNFGVEEISVKWPNDIYFYNYKVAGILVEIYSQNNYHAHVVIGIGINLAMNKKIVANLINQKWINIQDSGINIDRNLLTTELTNALHIGLLQFESNGFKSFLFRWHVLDYFYNRPVRLLIEGEKEIKGIARGIDMYGALLLEQQGTLHAYFSGSLLER